MKARNHIHSYPSRYFSMLNRSRKAFTITELLISLSIAVVVTSMVSQLMLMYGKGLIGCAQKSEITGTSRFFTLNIVADANQTNVAHLYRDLAAISNADDRLGLQASGNCLALIKTQDARYSKIILYYLGAEDENSNTSQIYRAERTFQSSIAPSTDNAIEGIIKDELKSNRFTTSVLITDATGLINNHIFERKSNNQFLLGGTFNFGSKLKNVRNNHTFLVSI